mmetsp:Transcript_85184/g.164046  ORF Transcript_85184/g.164046 Transcript_85184/m.164046 type:complete len:85 (+) Transcript_85184:292-546(+)
MVGTAVAAPAAIAVAANAGADAGYDNCLHGRCPEISDTQHEVASKEGHKQQAKKLGRLPRCAAASTKQLQVPPTKKACYTVEGP